MEKRGVSPLIATVLLIAFAIVLAAVVVNWGQNIIKGAQEETPASGITICPRVDFKITEAKRNSNAIGTPTGNVKDIRIVVRNDVEIPIQEVVVRIFGPPGGSIDSLEKRNSDGTPYIEAFEDKIIFIANGEHNVSNPQQIEVIPKIKVEDKTITCQAASETYNLV